MQRPEAAKSNMTSSQNLFFGDAEHCCHSIRISFPKNLYTPYLMKLGLGTTIDEQFDRAYDRGNTFFMEGRGGRGKGITQMMHNLQ